MAEQYSPLTGLDQQATGANVDTWGDVLNNNQLILEQAAKGVASFSVCGTYSLPYTTDSTDQSHFAILNVANGTGGTVLLQPTQGQFLVLNNASGDVVFQIANANTSVALVHAGVCSVICNDGGAVHQLGAGGVSVDDQIAAALANARAYTDSTAFGVNQGILPAQPDHAGQSLFTNGSVAMWRAPLTADIPDLANVVVMQSGSTMGSNLYFRNAGSMGIGNGPESGLYGDGATIALRGFSGTAPLALQTYGGEETLASFSSSGATLNVPLAAPAILSNGSAVWTAATLTPAALTTALNYTPVNKAGDTLSAPIYFSDADGLGIGSGPSTGLAGDGATVYLRAYSDTGTIALQTEAGASTLATVSSSGANFDVPLSQAGNAVWTTGTLNPASFQPAGNYQPALGYTAANQAGDVFQGHTSINYSANALTTDAGEMLCLTNYWTSGDQRTIALGTSPNLNGYVRSAHGAGLDLIVGSSTVATFGPNTILMSSRPLYAGNEAYDTGNLDIGLYAPLLAPNLTAATTSTIPTTPTAVANKSYVDGAVSSAVGSLTSLRAPNKVVLTFSGSWTPPNGVTAVWVELVGSGGGGAGAGSGKSGGAGGAGGYSEGSVSVTPGQAISYTVASGGAGGVAGGDGSPGSTTTFANISGSGGGAGSYTASTAGGGGGVGSGGSLSVYGGCGTDGNPAGTDYAGDGGASRYGGGGRGGAGQGVPGYAYGSGGGGAYGGTGPGGAGAGGLIILTY
jgi:hypothetical protein